jgi:predicted RNA-binding protein YlqC (UPF0109 family)
MTEGNYEAGDVNLVDNNETALDDDEEYEAGDVNTIGRSAPVEPKMPKAVLSYVANFLADDKDAIEIDVEERNGSSLLRLRVAQPDMGRVIGRRGRTAQAIRTVVGAAGAKEGIKTGVDIADV